MLSTETRLVCPINTLAERARSPAGRAARNVMPRKTVRPARSSSTFGFLSSPQWSRARDSSEPKGDRRRVMPHRGYFSEPCDFATTMRNRYAGPFPRGSYYAFTTNRPILPCDWSAYQEHFRTLRRVAATDGSHWRSLRRPRKMVRVTPIREHRPARSVLANDYGSRRFQGFHPSQPSAAAPWLRVLGLTPKSDWRRTSRSWQPQSNFQTVVKLLHERWRKAAQDLGNVVSVDRD